MGKKADKRSGAAMAVNSSATFKVVTVLRWRKTGRVLYLEAGKDFVDTLLSFLLLPIGIIIHMLSNAGGQVKALDRGISGVFKSVERLDRSFLHVGKESQLQPRPAAVAGASGSTGLLIQGLNAAVTKHPSKDMIELPNVYYQCIGCLGIAMTRDTKCTKCGADLHDEPVYVVQKDIDSLKEEIVKKLVEEEDSSDLVGRACSTNSGQGFVREYITYMVTDSLEVMPSTTIRSIQVLNKLKIATLADLESTDINVSVTQILQLLQAAITSSTCLNDVFAQNS